MPYKPNPKLQHIGLGLLVLFIALSIWWPLFQKGLPVAHDGESHLARFANYYIAIKEGQLPPRWAPNLMNRYGYPVFNYNYPLANILSVPLTVANVAFENTFKVLALLSLTSGALGVWFWLGSWRFSKTARALSVIAYISAPYLISAVLMRGSIGEVMVLGLLPWVLWWTAKLARSPTLGFMLLGGVLLGLLLLTHNVTGLIGLALVFYIGSLQWGRNKNIWKRAVQSLSLAIGLSLWFWLPALLESSQVVVFSAGIQKELTQHFVTLRQLLTSPLTFGFSTADPVEGLSLGIGAVGVATLWAVVIGLLVSLTLIWQQNADLAIIYRLKVSLKGISRLGSRAWLSPQSRLIFSLVIIIGVLLWLQTDASLWLWSFVPQLSIIQFPWRLMLFVTLLILPVTAWVWDRGWWTLRGLIVLAIILQVWAAASLEIVDRLQKNYEDYIGFAQSTSTQNENRPATFEYINIGDWQPRPTFLEGEAEIRVVSWKGSSHRYLLQATTPVTVVEPTASFLGWQTQAREIDADQNLRPTYINSDEIAGRIAYTLPSGSYEVTTRFTQATSARYIGNAVFVITIVFVLFLGCRLIVKEFQKTNNNMAPQVEDPETPPEAEDDKLCSRATI